MIGRGAVTLDSVNYYLRYINVEYQTISDTYEIGYHLLQKFAHHLGFDFLTFRITVTFIALILMDFLVRKVTDNKTYLFGSSHKSVHNFG